MGMRNKSQMTPEERKRIAAQQASTQQSQQQPVGGMSGRSSVRQAQGGAQRSVAATDKQPPNYTDPTAPNFVYVDPALRETIKRFESYMPGQITSVADTGPAEMQATLAQRQSALEGYQAPELEAMRAQMAAGQQAGQQQRERALQAALAQRGIQGGTAAALQAQMAQRAYQEKGAMDTEMMLRQEQRQREALGEYEKSVMGAYQAEQERQFQELSARLAAEQAFQAEQTRQAQLQEAQDYADAQVEAAEAQDSGLCCFIFLEADDGVLHRIARRARDEMMTPRNRRGYYKLSEVFVPLMRKSSVFKFIVKWTMVRPMISFGKFKYNEGRVGRLFKPVADFWFSIFEYLGQDHPFKRENGELV